MEDKNRSCCGEEESCGGRRCGSAGVKVVGLLVLGAVLIVGLLKDTALFNSNDYNTIQVIGQGKVPVKPDAALVNLGVLTIKAATPEEAIDQTSQKLEKVNAALEALGIPEENRQVTGYVVNPRYKDGAAEAAVPGAAGTPSIDGYTCSQQITVRIPGVEGDKEMINKVIAAAAKEGANQVGEVKFIASNAESIKQRARLAAVADAKEKAGRMAEAAGVRLGRLTSWYENVIAAPGQPYPQSPYGPVESQAAQNPTPSGIIVLQPGQLDMIVELTVSYKVK
jgi:uncharacterized protein YggE